MRGFKILIAMVLLSVFLIGCQNNTTESKEKNELNEKTLTIAAAVSLSDALEEMKPIFEKEYDAKLTFNLGSSGKLAQQIQNGAPADVFISANRDWMDKLEASGEVIKETREDVTGNQIVMITPASSQLDISEVSQLVDADEIEQIAVGNPDTVPAGEYTYEALTAMGFLNHLESKFVIAKDVRQVLTYVETENTEVGFVYESDAHSSDKTKIVSNIDDQYHAPIVYPAAVVKASNQAELAAEFIDFLLRDQAQEILEAQGFRK